MFEISQIAAYILVVTALFLVPGPAVLLTLARSTALAARRRRRIGGNLADPAQRRRPMTGKLVGSIYVGLGVQLALLERR